MASYKLDKRFYDMIYAEVGGGPEEEVAAVASTFLNRADRHGYEKALTGSSAYTKKSKEYKKASTAKFTPFEQQVYDRNKGIVDTILTNPNMRLPYTHFENVKVYGEPKWAKGQKNYQDIGRQRFYVIK